MACRDIVVVGGGAAGFFAAITAAEANPDARVTVYEKSARFLEKVRISGGGRCNVTHACFDPRELTARYPRGERELISPYHRFQARNTVDWFQSRGVQLKTEADGRMFPTTDSSQTIIDCLMRSAREAGVRLVSSTGVEAAEKKGDQFHLRLSTNQQVLCDRLLLSTGGCRTPALGALATSLGHTLEPPVPSLFTFNIQDAWVRDLAGLSVEKAEITVPGTKLKESGPLLFTHWGLSGPAVLRLSAWGARELHHMGYQFQARIKWVPGQDEPGVASQLREHARKNGAKQVRTTAMFGLPARLWEALILLAGVPRDMRWSAFTAQAEKNLARHLTATELPVSGKSLNKDEFVTCGGVRLKEVNFKTMESRICPGLFFAGELLDIDGITGGFNFQAAWTTGWIAGQSMADAS